MSDLTDSNGNAVYKCPCSAEETRDWSGVDSMYEEMYPKIMGES